LVKAENGDKLSDPHNILNRWKSYFSQLLNVQSGNDVRQIKIHAAETLVPDLSPFEVKIDIDKLRKSTSPGSDQILAKLIQGGGETLV
jgi:hypothetical protein